MVKMWFVCVSLLVLFYGVVRVNASEKTDPVSQLRWLDDMNASEAFAHDVKTETFRFYAVYGYSMEMRSIGRLNYERCYAKYATLETIEGTSDDEISLEHSRLNRKARDFSTHYNAMMRAYLQEHGWSECPKGVDWDAAFDRLTEFVWWGTSQERDPFSEGGRVTYQNQESHVIFVIRLKDLSRSLAVKQKACQIFAESGIESSARFNVTKYKIGMKEEPFVIDEFVCRGGKIVENRTLPPKHDGKEEK